MNNSQFGLPQGVGEEQTVWFHWDTLVYADSASLVATSFFSPDSGAKHAQYRTTVFPVAATQKLRIVGMRVIESILFTAGVGSTAAETALYHEQFSTISIKKEQKSYTPYPIGLLKSNAYYAEGGTAAVREKFDDYYKLPEPIDIPSQGRFEILFNPALSLTTGTGEQYLPNAPITLASNLGHMIKLELACVTQQAVV